jgi:hypothetical protein
MPGHLIDVALEALSKTDTRSLRMREKDEDFRMLKNFLKGVFVLVDINADRMPAPNSRKKKIIDIINHVALEQYTFIKDGAPITVKVCRPGRLSNFLTLLDRTTSNGPTTET